MHRFFVDKGMIIDGGAKIEGDDAAHISKVLRLRRGDEIIVCDGNGFEYVCSISSVDKKEVECRIQEIREVVSEPPVKVDLYQAMPKASKMDLIVQKCTELGIYNIIPMDTERVVVRMEKKNDFMNKVSRWKKIAQEAAKQSGRGRIPDISDPVKYDDAVENLKDYDLVIMPYEKEESTGLKEALRCKNKINNVAILIGPEGGFTEDEVNKAKGNGAVSVTLGPRILRTETAGFSCLSMVMYEIGDMGGGIWQQQDSQHLGAR